MSKFSVQLAGLDTAAMRKISVVSRYQGPCRPTSILISVLTLRIPRSSEYSKNNGGPFGTPADFYAILYN
jgi:hypothetical protein